MRYLVLLPLYFCQITFAGELTIFDVRKPVALSDKETVQKDFYIDSGSEAGLQKGMIVTVIRKVPLYDTYQSRSAGDLKVEVAKIKIIQVQQGLSVARFAANIPRADIPILEEDYIMIGDRLDMSTATKDKRSASNDEGTGSSADGGTAPASVAPAIPAPAAPTPPPAPAAAAPSEPEKKPEPVTKLEPGHAPAQITSQKIEALAPKDPGLSPTEGPAIQ